MSEKLRKDKNPEPRVARFAPMDLGEESSVYARQPLMLSNKSDAAVTVRDLEFVRSEYQTSQFQ